MTDLDPSLHARLDALVRSDRVVLFMKGSRTTPMCGFSARVVQKLDALIDDFSTVNILDDATVREGMKAYTGWPTFPQLFVDGEFVGGADIVAQLDEAGELAAVLGGPPKRPLSITLTDAAAARIRGVMDGEDHALRLIVTETFGYQFASADEPEPGDVTVVTHGIRLVLDRDSARRADGLTMDFADGPNGPGLVVDNPNEPPPIRSLTVEQLAAWRAEGRAFHLLDVRTPEEWEIARIDGAVLLDDDGIDHAESLPATATIVMMCHHGVRSRRAAEHFRAQGWRDLYNLEGGIDAWSMRIDPTVARY